MLVTYFVDTNKLTLQFIPYFKAYYKIIAMNTIWEWRKVKEFIHETEIEEKREAFALRKDNLLRNSPGGKSTVPQS